MFQSLLIFWVCTAGYISAHSMPIAAYDERTEKAAHVVVGKIIDVAIARDEQDPDWDLRTFRYQLLIEADEKGDLKRGDTIQLKAWASNWIGKDNEKEPWSLGNSPLPLAGERGRFFLSTPIDQIYDVVLPNGVELDPSADATDPRRVGNEAVDIEEDVPKKIDTPTSKDPFGWDVILILLGIPFIVGAIRQKTRSRWGLLVTGALMFIGAAIIIASS